MKDSKIILKKTIQIIFIFNLITSISLLSSGTYSNRIKRNGDNGKDTTHTSYSKFDLTSLGYNPTELPSELSIFLKRYEVDRAALLRYYNIPDFPVTYFILYNSPVSKDCYNNLKKFFTDWNNKLSLINFESLWSQSKIDYLLFKHFLKRELIRLERSEQRMEEISPLIPFSQKLIYLVDSKRRMDPLNPEKTAAILDEIQNEIKETMTNIKIGNLIPKKTIAKRAEETLPNLQDSLNSWFHFYYGYDPLFTWWTKEPYQKVNNALKEYKTFLQKEVMGIKTKETIQIIAHPIGRNALLDELAHEMIPYSPEELIEIGKKELKWCEKELKKTAQELGFGDNWKKAIEHIKTHHVEPGKQPETVRNMALEAIEFVEEQNLVTVPELAKKIWQMEMTPPELQPRNPFITGGEIIRMSYPHYILPHEDKLMIMRSNNIHTSRAIVHHELIPGHHLQGFMNKRFYPYRSSLFRTDFWREGWALYWEMLLFNLGFPRSPEDKIGMLFWRMHRCARIIFALSFHLEKMSPEEAINFLVERVGHERFSAIGEVRRPLERDRPLQPLSYMIGALQYKAMRQELVVSGRMTDRQFHDAILQNNYMPIAILRSYLIGQTLSEDFFPNWRFYEKVERY